MPGSKREAVLTATRHADAPIGVFDSGVGGLSVLREIRRLLPHEELLYVADSAHAPYGERPDSFIAARSFAIAEFLCAAGAKAIVVACNTATAAAIAALRARFTLPIVGMEPAIKPAAGTTRTGVVGVLATNGTLAGQKFAELLVRFGAEVKVLVQPCPGLVERIEAGDLSSPATRALLAGYVAPLLQRGADTLVLGCTHYPFVRDLIEQLAGPAVNVIDPSPAVARELQRRLTQDHLLTPAAGAGRLRVWSSAPEKAPVLTALWGEPLAIERLPEQGGGVRLDKEQRPV
jgi:glutamate racemase